MGLICLRISWQPNVVVGLALFYGGMVQFAAGMWEFVSDSTPPSYLRPKKHPQPFDTYNSYFQISMGSRGFETWKKKIMPS